jgi:hypothetical protein
MKDHPMWLKLYYYELYLLWSLFMTIMSINLIISKLNFYMFKWKKLYVQNKPSISCLYKMMIKFVNFESHLWIETMSKNLV